MSKNRIKLLIMLICGILLTGCWSRREIEDLGFATMIALDEADNDKIELCVQFAVTGDLGGNESNQQGGAEAPAWTARRTADSLATAMNQLERLVGKHPIWSHAEVIIIGENLAKKGIAPLLDYMMRNRDFRLSSWVMISEGPAKRLLELTPPLTKLPADQVRELNQLARETSVSLPRRLIDLLRVLLDEPGYEAILPMLRTERSGTEQQDSTQEANCQEEPQMLTMEGMAVFRGDKLVGKLNARETRGLLWLRGESKRGTIRLDMPGNGFVVQEQIYARRVLQIIREDDNLRAKITIYQDGDLIEHNLNQLELNPGALQELDTLLAAKIQIETEAALKRIQQDLQADVIGIGTRIYRLYPKLFNSLDWQTYFPTMPIELEVHANFRRPSETMQSPLTSKYNR